MIVLNVNVNGLSINKAEGDSPVSAYPNAPNAPAVASQLM
jgi:hypothetical protein